MSEVMLTIMDADRAIHGSTHGSHADRVVAALSAEPETIEELEAAVARFIKPRAEYRVFEFFEEGICEEPWDAGIVIVDLAARLAASESSYSYLEKEGGELYHNGSFATDVRVYYQVPDDWLFIDYIEGWQERAQERREERAATPPLDARKVIYGEVTTCIVHECLFEAVAGTEGPIADIHARWLMTSRTDLQGQSPREVLLAKQGFIDRDLQWRANQWAFLSEPPPELSRESTAYRFGGFGTHEYVVYYNLIRHLLDACWHRVSHDRNVDVASEIERLERLKEEWLHTPQYDFDSMSPFDVIDHERRRLPVTASGVHAGIDDDCPLCQMMRESDNPTFWHLDGCNMDDDFPFSFHLTREEWEEEQRSWEELDRKWEERRNNPSVEEDEIDDLLSPVWERSYTHPDALEVLSPEAAIEIALVGMGGHLAELGLTLREVPAEEGLAESLQRDFADLRDALHTDPEVPVEAIIHRFGENLTRVAVRVPDLAGKCADLQSQLERLGNLFEEQAEGFVTV